MPNNMLTRVQILQRYMLAMKNGDIETFAMLLQVAEQDQALENMLLEANASYQDEFGTLILQDDIVQAQQLMRTLAHTIRKDTMQSPIFHADDDSAQIPTLVTTEHSRSVHLEKHALMPPPLAKKTTKKWYRSPKSWVPALAAAILICFILLQSNVALANQILSLFGQQRPIAIDIPTIKGDYPASWI